MKQLTYLFWDSVWGWKKDRPVAWTIHTIGLYCIYIGPHKNAPVFSAGIFNQRPRRIFQLLKLLNIFGGIPQQDYSFHAIYAQEKMLSCGSHRVDFVEFL
jgi:hypothetical protein